MTSTNEYLASIDGLRAVAVLSVLLFHIDLSCAEGGFIGVDVFFVISGFLITQNILRDVRTGSWSFSEFYRRRIARLFPALFSVILVTTVVAYSILIPPDLERLAKSALSATFSVSNLFFYSEAGYFAADAASKPLLHTWSLSVEEQFYLVWPLLVVLVSRYWGRTGLIVAIVTISCVALVSSVVVNPTIPERVFFLTPFRAYQFGLGALVAISNAPQRMANPRVTTALGFGSVGIIILLATAVEGDDPVFLIATLPALATAAFLVACEGEVVKTVFASGPMTWIGRRSYSIYLTHWPIIVLWKIRTGASLTATEQVAAVAAAFATGHLLHVLVETRFRLRRGASRATKRIALAVAATLALSVVAVSATYWQQAGFPERTAAELADSVKNLQPRWTERQQNLRTSSCNMLIGKLGTQTVADFDRELCFTVPPGKPAYLVLGDSFASGAYLYFREAYPDVHFGQLTIPGCRIRPPEEIANTVCAEFFAAVLNSREQLAKYDGVILASNWTFTDMDSIERLIDGFTQLGQHVVLVGQRIRFDAGLPSIILASLSRQHATSKANSRLMPQQSKINALMRRKFADRVSFIDLIALQCPAGCDIFTPSGDVIYLDASHLSLEGVSVIAQRLRAAYPDLLR